MSGCNHSREFLLIFVGTKVRGEQPLGLFVIFKQHLRNLSPVGGTFLDGKAIPHFTEAKLRREFR